MPQLMPFLWISSVFMSVFLLMMLVLMYYYKVEFYNLKLFNKFLSKVYILKW